MKNPSASNSVKTRVKWIEEISAQSRNHFQKFYVRGSGMNTPYNLEGNVIDAHTKYQIHASITNSERHYKRTC